MHEVARERSREIAMAPVDREFEVVLTTNAGYPLDQNLYQAVKGMSAAATVVRPGGLILCAAECRDGFPDHGSYREVLASAASPQALFDEISARETTVPDQWQVQVQAKISMRARVGVHSEHLSTTTCARRTSSRARPRRGRRAGARGGRPGRPAVRAARGAR
jgi:nickel-dependent lactate racemase